MKYLWFRVLERSKCLFKGHEEMKEIHPVTMVVRGRICGRCGTKLGANNKRE